MKRLLIWLSFIFFWTNIGFALQTPLLQKDYIWSFDRLLGVEKYDYIPKAQVVEVDVLDTPISYIHKLKDAGKIVVGYINVGAIEKYRQDYKLFDKSVIGNVYPDWPDERFLDISNYNNFKDRMLWRLDVAYQKGFDAVEFDNIDTFEDKEQIGFDISKQDMVDYLKWLQEEASKRDLFVLQKNAPELVMDLVNVFDGALLESAFEQNRRKNFLPYLQQNKPVFAVEYVEETSKAKFEDKICPLMQKYWFVGALKNYDLDQFVVECFEPQSKWRWQIKQKMDKILPKFAQKISIKPIKTQIKIYTKFQKQLSRYQTNSAQKQFVIDYLQKYFANKLYQLQAQKLLPYKNKLYWWAYEFFTNNENLVSQERLKAFDQLVPQKPLRVYFTNNWELEGIKFPQKNIALIDQNWQIPFVRLMPSWEFASSGYQYSLKRIVDGNFDEQLKKRADDAKAWQKPLLIDFAVEPNWDWFAWSHRPTLWAQAYRHIIDIFRQRWAYNITWFYHFNIPSFPQQKRNNPWAYYPWDEYIDWVGASFYGSLMADEQVQWLSKKIYSYQNLIKKLNKPFAILEFGIIKNQYTQAWFEDFLQTAIQNIDWIKAVSIWHEKWQNEDESFSDLLLTPDIVAIFNKLKFWQYIAIVPKRSK